MPIDDAQRSKLKRITCFTSEPLQTAEPFHVFVQELDRQRTSFSGSVQSCTRQIFSPTFIDTLVVVCGFRTHAMLCVSVATINCIVAIEFVRLKQSCAVVCTEHGLSVRVRTTDISKHRPFPLLRTAVLIALC